MISIELDGTPIALKRPKFSTQNGCIRTYDSQKTEKEQTRWQIKAQFREEPLSIPLAIDLLFFMPIPKSTSSIKRKQMENGLLSHIKKPDLDNLIKYVLDCMNGIVFADDSQIIEIRSRKLYSSRPGTTSRIIPLASEKRDLLYENHSRSIR